MKIFSERDIAIAKGHARGKKYTELAKEYGISSSRCRGIAIDVARHVACTGSSTTTRDFYQSDEAFCDAIDKYVDRVTNRKIAPSAPNRARHNVYLLNGVPYTWHMLHRELLYRQEEDGSWTMPLIDSHPR